MVETAVKYLVVVASVGVAAFVAVVGYPWFSRLLDREFGRRWPDDDRPTAAPCDAVSFEEFSAARRPVARVIPIAAFDERRAHRDLGYGRRERLSNVSMSAPRTGGTVVALIQAREEGSDGRRY